MSKNATAGRISINLSAGTAQFVVDMEKANAKIREFGAGHKHTVSDVQATSAALRTLEGGVTNNLRAAENFLAKTLNLGSALKTAFPVVGAIALGGVISELIGKASEAYEAFQKLQEAPKRITQEFQNLNQPIRVANDELRVSNDRLENEIAKLQGKPQNGLKLALDETILSADKLAESLNRDLEQIQKLLEQEHIGSFKGFFTNNAATSDLDDQFKQFREKFVDLSLQTYDKADRAANDKERAAVYVEATNQRKKAVQDYVGVLKEQLRTAESLQKIHNQPQTGAVADSLGRGPVPQSAQPQPDQSARISALKGEIDNLQQVLAGIALSGRNTQLQGVKAGLEASATNTRLDQPVHDKITELQSALRGAQAEARVAGTDLFTEALAKSAAEADKAVTELNKRLAEGKVKGRTVSLGELSEITALETQIALTDAKKKSAEEQARVQKEMVQGASDLADKIDEENRKRADTLARMDEEIEAAQKLAAAETQGSEAVFQARLKINLAKIADPDVKAKTDALDQAEHTAEIAKTVAQVNRETEAIERRTDAVLGGVAAQREAALEDIRQSGEAPDVIAARIKAQQAQYQWEDAAQLKNLPASAGIRAYFQEVVDNAQSAAMQVKNLLGNAFNSLNDTLARAITGQKTNWADFFQGISADLAKMGLENAEKTLAQGVLGKLGKGSGQPWDEKAPGGVVGKIGGLFGLGGADGQRDGSSEASALYVQMAGGVESSPSGIFNHLFGGADEEGEDGASSGIGSFFKGLFGGFRASGGSVDPGTAYMVGEKGPELWMPPSKGTIIPNDKLGGAGAMYYIDARGANAADVEQRVQQSLVAVHGSAVKNSAAVQAEMQKRKPLGAR